MNGNFFSICEREKLFSLSYPRFNIIRSVRKEFALSYEMADFIKMLLDDSVGDCLVFAIFMIIFIAGCWRNNHFIILHMLSLVRLYARLIKWKSQFQITSIKIWACVDGRVGKLQRPQPKSKCLMRKKSNLQNITNDDGTVRIIRWIEGFGGPFCNWTIYKREMKIRFRISKKKCLIQRTKNDNYVKMRTGRKGNRQNWLTFKCPAAIGITNYLPTQKKILFLPRKWTFNIMTITLNTCYFSYEIA